MEMCPGLVLEKHVLSADQLRDHAATVYSWPPADIYTALLSGGSRVSLLNPLTHKEESFTQLVCFGSQDVSTVSFVNEHTIYFSKPLFCFLLESIFNTVSIIVLYLLSFEGCKQFDSRW